MVVLLRQQILQGAHLAHQGKEVGVIEKEHMQAHLDMVAFGVFPAAHLAAHERPGLIKIHLMAGVHQIHGGGQSSQTGADDGDSHPCAPMQVPL